MRWMDLQAWWWFLSATALKIPLRTGIQCDRYHVLSVVRVPRQTLLLGSFLTLWARARGFWWVYHPPAHSTTPALPIVVWFWWNKMKKSTVETKTLIQCVSSTLFTSPFDHPSLNHSKKWAVTKFHREPLLFLGFLLNQVGRWWLLRILDLR